MTKSLSSKVALLVGIKENKDVLFGKFSSTLDHEKKEKAWQEVTVLAKSLGLADASKDWIFVRDSLYGQWKSRTLKKRDNRGKTGTEGGPKSKLNEMDQIILEIVGKDSPTIVGLPVSETWEPTFMRN